MGASFQCPCSSSLDNAKPAIPFSRLVPTKDSTLSLESTRVVSQRVLLRGKEWDGEKTLTIQVCPLPGFSIWLGKDMGHYLFGGWAVLNCTGTKHGYGEGEATEKAPSRFPWKGWAWASMSCFWKERASSRETRWQRDSAKIGVAERRVSGALC